MLAFTWRFNEHSKDFKFEVCLEGYGLFSPPREIFSQLYFLGSLSRPHTNPQIARRNFFLECLLKMVNSLFLLVNLLKI